MIRSCLLVLCLAFASGALARSETPLPSDSVYQLPALLVDQDARPFTLAQRRGRPQLLAMFYTSCRYVCPLIIDSALGVDHALSGAQRGQLDVLLVSLDPERDTPAALRAVAEQRKLDRQRWTLARTDAASVRKLAALLGVRYRALAGGDFNHTSALILLDADGRVLARTETLGSAPDSDFLAKVRAAVRAPSAAGKSP